MSDPGSLALLNWRAKQFKWDGFVLHSISGRTYDEPGKGTESRIFAYPAFELFQKNSSAFSAIFAYRHARNLNVAVKGQAYLASAEYVSGDYFRGLEVPPGAGRLIIPDDDRVGAPSVAVVSFAFSQRAFGGPASAAGQSV